MSIEQQNQLMGTCHAPNFVQHFNQNWINQKKRKIAKRVTGVESVLDNSYTKISVAGNLNMIKL